MATHEHVRMLLRSVEEWNNWRKKNPYITPDLSRANLIGVNLIGANLSRVNLTEADLTRVNLTEANLFKADLTKANLCQARLCKADLSWSNLTEVKNVSPAQFAIAKNVEYALNAPACISFASVWVARQAKKEWEALEAAKEAAEKTSEG